MILICNIDALDVTLSSMTNPHAWLLSDLSQQKQNGITVFSTFACGGGSTMGYKLAGCSVIGANDIDPVMAHHYRLNHHPKYYYLCPVKELLSQQLPDEMYNLDILDGSPPCSSFSMSGNREKDWGKLKHFREGQSKQVLDDLFFDYLSLAEKLSPKVCIAENVKGMILGNAKGYTRLIFKQFKEIGYRVQVFLVNAADCGVPQARERVFFVALRDDIVKPKLKLAPKHPWVSCEEATLDLQILTPTEIVETNFTCKMDLNWWAKTPQGKGYDDAVVKAGFKMKFFSHRKLHPKRPSNTLIAGPTCFKHWIVPRYLTFREWVRLGSFPDDYKVDNPKIGKYIIGMSVPPRMMEQVAKAVISQWL